MNIVAIFQIPTSSRQQQQQQRRVTLLTFLFIGFTTLLSTATTTATSSSSSSSCQLKRNVEDYVNILGGTDSQFDLSHGSTLPLIGRPWGFNYYAPETNNNNGQWWFHPSDRRFFGLRVTHQPSPWIGDYGQFLLKAYIPSQPSDTTASRDLYAAYTPSSTTFAPYYFSTRLLNYGNAAGLVQLEFTPSHHGGIAQISFPPYLLSDGLSNQLRRIAITLSGGQGDMIEMSQAPGDGTVMIHGYTTINSGGVGASVGENENEFRHYFVLLIYCGSGGDEVTKLTNNTHLSSTDAWIDFSPEDPRHDRLTVRFATSLISHEQALVNLDEEVSIRRHSFSSLLEESREEWRSVLSRVQVIAWPEDYKTCEIVNLLTIFYSSLYRASLFPRQLTEWNQVKEDQEEAVHWSPYINNNDNNATSTTNRMQSGLLSTDSGFWDAWNTVYPLLSLINRPMLSATMEGWLTAYKEGGWLPKWASPGYRGSMVGTMGDVSLASAIVNDLPGLDTLTAYEAIRKDAFEVPPVGVEGVGRVCLPAYLTHGYIPRDAVATTGGTCSEVVSRSLNYLQSDYAIGQAAKKLDRMDDFTLLQDRAVNYSLLFDEEKGFFRSRNILNGKWTEPWDEFAWGQDYTEGGPWQFRFYLPYDPVGLQTLYQQSGRDLCQELQRTQTTNSYFHIGGYGNVIHEQTEMADHCRGQYAHNNQPVHHMLYMHMIDGYQGPCSQQGRHWIHETLLNFYKPSADMFPGDEDNGEMGAWFVLSSLGLYELSPGSGMMVLGLPLFDLIEVDISDLPHSAQMKRLQRYQMEKKRSTISSIIPPPVMMESRTLRIETKRDNRMQTKVKRILWNDQEIDATKNTIAYSTLAQGGVLTFELMD
eukprot:scaffold1290_cov248-Ochromonas_danica.AAC.12